MLKAPESHLSTPGFFRVVCLMVMKDLAVETRSKEIVYTTIFFAVSCMLVFAFGFVQEGREIDHVAAGILWVTVTFAGTLALGRTFERERQNETLRAILITPVDRPAIYVGKLLVLLILMAAVEMIVVPLVSLMFQVPIFEHSILLVMLLITGTSGFLAVGTLFAAMLVRVKSRGVLLPVVLYPMTIPVIIAGVRGTALLFQPEADLAMVQAWIGMLVFFDTVFITLSLWVFEPLMKE